MTPEELFQCLAEYRLVTTDLRHLRSVCREFRRLFGIYLWAPDTVIIVWGPNQQTLRSPDIRDLYMLRICDRPRIETERKLIRYWLYRTDNRPLNRVFEGEFARRYPYHRDLIFEDSRPLQKMPEGYCLGRFAEIFGEDQLRPWMLENSVARFMDIGLQTRMILRLHRSHRKQRQVLGRYCGALVQYMNITLWRAWKEVTSQLPRRMRGKQGLFWRGLRYLRQEYGTIRTPNWAYPWRTPDNVWKIPDWVLQEFVDGEAIAHPRLGQR